MIAYMLVSRDMLLLPQGAHLRHRHPENSPLHLRTGVPLLPAAPPPPVANREQRPQRVIGMLIQRTGKSTSLYVRMQQIAHLLSRASYGYDVNSPQFKEWQAQQQQQYAQYYAQAGYAQGAPGGTGAQPAAPGSAPPPSDPAPPPPPA